MKLILKLSAGLFIVLFALSVHAQIPVTLDGLDISADIQNPQPGESVNISLESFSLDLSSASIIWIVNGETKNKGIGIRSISVIAPKIGASNTIKAVVQTTEGKEIEKTLIMKSGSVDIIWETQGYVPPFFKGKMPLVYQNTVRLVAIPHLSKDGKNELDPKTLVYIWRSGGKYIPDAQGYGKQAVTIMTDMIPKPLDIRVEVYDREKTQYTEGSIIIEPSAPSLSFYEEDSLYGVLFNKALSNRISLKNSEMKIRAVPFGFNIDLKKDMNSYAWSINNVSQPDLLKNQSITIRTKGDTEGSSDIKLDIRNQSNILQGAEGGFTVYFNKKEVSEEDQSVTF